MHKRVNNLDGRALRETQKRVSWGFGIEVKVEVIGEVVEGEMGVEVAHTEVWVSKVEVVAGTEAGTEVGQVDTEADQAGREVGRAGRAAARAAVPGP